MSGHTDHDCCAHLAPTGGAAPHGATPRRAGYSNIIGGRSRAVGGVPAPMASIQGRSAHYIN